MAFYAVVVFLSLVVSSHSFPSKLVGSKIPFCYPFPFVSREEWNARPPASVIEQNIPVPLVVIHHTSVPAACYNQKECAQSMRSMQNMHQITNGWDDIGYNFAIGSDGAVYEGRGWNRVGAHAVGFNVNSVGIVFIGDWVSTVPPKSMLNIAHDLVAVGVELGYISPEYKLVGHRQVGRTECPGEALFREISTWERFASVI